MESKNLEEKEGRQKEKDEAEEKVQGKEKASFCPRLQTDDAFATLTITRAAPTPSALLHTFAREKAAWGSTPCRTAQECPPRGLEG